MKISTKSLGVMLAPYAERLTSEGVWEPLDWTSLEDGDVLRMNYISHYGEPWVYREEFIEL